MPAGRKVRMYGPQQILVSEKDDVTLSDGRLEACQAREVALIKSAGIEASEPIGKVEGVGLAALCSRTLSEETNAD